MINPKISVIMAVYNEEKFLKESIDSILNQTFNDFELIIINDCSTDSSLKIMKSHQDKRIRIINNNKNVGFLNSRNKALKIARGKYIAILDGDDVSLPERFKIQFNYLEMNPNIFLVGSSAIFINEKGIEISRFRKYNDYELLAWRMPVSCGILSPSVMFRNEGYVYNQGFGGAGDYDLYLRMLSDRKRLTNLPDFLVKYRVHGGSMSIYNRLKQEKYRDLIKEKNKFKGRFKIRFLPKLFIHYLKTYKEKRGL